MVEAVKDSLGEGVNLEQLKQAVLNLDESGLTALSQKYKPMTVLQNPEDLLYVPAGWLAAEASAKGMLIYGLRKTIMIKEPKFVANYRALIGAMFRGGSRVEKMKDVLTTIEDLNAD